MADHLRNQIRDAVAASGVLGNLSTTGTRVYTSRVYDMQDANLPGLRIFTSEEAIAVQSLGMVRIRERTLTLIVEACVKANTAYDDTVDDIAKEVEIALDANNTLGTLCKWIEPKQFTLEIDGDGDKAIAVGKMVFEVRYYAAKGTPDVPH